MLKQGPHRKRKNETSNSRAYKRSLLRVSGAVTSYLLARSLRTGKHDTGGEASSLDEPFEEEGSRGKVED
jgi:hypothetical protein